jgi:hypothetical protein
MNIFVLNENILYLSANLSTRFFDFRNATIAQQPQVVRVSALRHEKKASPQRSRRKASQV